MEALKYGENLVVASATPIPASALPMPPGAIPYGLHESPPWQFWPAASLSLVDDVGRTLLWILLIIYFCERFKVPLATFIGNLRSIGLPFAHLSADKHQPIAPPSPPAAGNESNAQTGQSDALARAWLYERTYNFIYGTQLALLAVLEYQTLDTAGVRQFYDLSVKSGNASNFEAYLAYLTNWDLVSAALQGNDVTYSITEKGRDFLRYVKNMGLTLNRAY